MDGQLYDTKAGNKIIMDFEIYLLFSSHIEICINYILLVFSGLLRSIVLKQIRITPIRNNLPNFSTLMISSFLTISPIKSVLFQKNCFFQP